MSDLAIKLVIGLVGKVLTETFLAKSIVYALRYLAKRTETLQLDDQVVEALAEALNVK